jgi:hypothetical protein
MTPSLPDVDLTLAVSVARNGTRGTRLALDLQEGNRRSRTERDLEGEPFAYFSGLIAEIERLNPLEPAARQVNEQLLISIGARLARDLLSEPIRARLTMRADGHDTHSLLIISDDPWIPWEILFLADAGGDGRFLGEAFALTVWTWDIQGCAGFPLSKIGTVFPPGSDLTSAGQEHEDLELLAQQSARHVERITPRLLPVLAALRSGDFSGLHFSGHGAARGSNPDLWSLPLENGEALRAVDLATCDLTRMRPLVFLNACRSSQTGLALTGLGGLARAFLEAGAGAVVGPRWEVYDRPARVFSRALYQAFLQGARLGQAALLARQEVRREFPGDPTWLAYTVFGHPDAAAGERIVHIPPPRRDEEWLEIPIKEWNPQKPFGALLRADHGVVPFHGRQRELAELHRWCTDGHKGVRLYTGRGGMGKTRLAIQLCRELRALGWRCGFIPDRSSREGEPPHTWARNFLRQGGPLLAVIDYAEGRDRHLVPLLQELAEVRDSGAYRLILLSRELGDWWDRLRDSPGSARDSLMGPSFSHRPLGPIAEVPEQRLEIFQHAARAFAEQLGKTMPEQSPEDLDDRHYRIVLFLHMAALGAVEGVKVKGEDGLLDWVLTREREFWRRQIKARELPPRLIRGVARTMATVTLVGGVPESEGAIELLSQFRHFNGQGIDVLTEVSHLLHETYPGERWISPLQPDILGEHLVERETEDDMEAIEIARRLRHSAGSSDTPHV